MTLAMRAKNSVRVNTLNTGLKKAAMPTIRQKSDAGQDWVGYSDTLSSLTSSSRGDYVEINYHPKFTSGLLITNRAGMNQNE
jgi:hypothetical protein